MSTNYCTHTGNSTICDACMGRPAMTPMEAQAKRKAKQYKQQLADAQAAKATLHKERNQLRDMLDRIDAIPAVADGYHAANEENIADGVEALAENYQEAQATIDAQLREAASLNQCITDLEEKAKRLEQRVKVLEQTISDSVESYSMLEQRQITTQQQLADAQATVTAQREEIVRLRHVRGGAMSMYDRGMMILVALFTGVTFWQWQQSVMAGVWMFCLCFFVSVVVASQYEEDEAE